MRKDENLRAAPLEEDRHCKRPGPTYNSKKTLSGPHKLIVENESSKRRQEACSGFSASDETETRIHANRYFHSLRSSDDEV